MKRQLFFYSLAISICSIFLVPASRAEVIEFPEEELAQESVLPKFDKPDVVKNRNVTTANRWEIAPYLGFNMTEPIYSQMRYGANIGYHWSEESAVALNFAKNSSGLNTQYTDALRSQYNLDFTRAPQLNYAYYLNYEYKAYYGKISLTKQGTMNLSTYPLIGLGMTSYENKTYPGLTGGIGQKFYFSKNFGLRFDLRLQYAQAPSPFLTDRIKATDPIPAKGDFEDKWSLSTILDLGVTFVF